MSELSGRSGVIADSGDHGTVPKLGVVAVNELKAPSSEGGHSHATSTDRAQVAMPGRFPWRSVSAGVASAGTPLGIAMLHPLLSEAMAIIELVVILAVLSTALYGSQTLSERAFRLLRWLGNRPEPPGPSAQGTVRVADHPTLP